MHTDTLAPDLKARYDELHQRLTLLADNADLNESQRELARSWLEASKHAHDEACKPLSVAFLAGVGRGKSSLIAAASGLRLHRSGLPHKWSVLPVGRGRTTLGETHVHFEERTDVRLRIEPIPAEELELEVRLYARDQWAARTDSHGKSPKPGAGEELHDLLREWLAPNAEDARKVIKQEVSTAASVEDLEEEWLDRLRIDQRSKPLERAFAADQDGYDSLREDLKKIMKGRLENAPAPRITRIYLPMTDLGREVGSIVDTQGIDADGSAWLAGRGDIRERISASELFVVCSSFNDAPDRVSVGLLESLSSKGPGRVLRPSGVRLLIVDDRPLDDDPDEQREHQIERRERIEQCRDKLRRNETIDLPTDAVVALNVCNEGEQLKAMLGEMAKERRDALCAHWKDVLGAAEKATATLKNEEFAAKVREVDLRLWWAWDAEVARWKMDAPDGLSELAKVFERARFNNEFHWSQLYASTRRRGRYSKLDLVKLGTESCVMVATCGLPDACIAVYMTAGKPAFAGGEAVARHVEMRGEQFASAFSRYYRNIYSAWEKTLSDHFKSPACRPMWEDCEARWGQGGGYVAYVAQRFRQEAERAALDPGPVEPISSFLPTRPKLFTLREVRLQNFRCVEERAISFADTTVLIGDNGTGKTCWLEAIATAIGTYLSGVGAATERELRDSDMRYGLVDQGGILNRNVQSPTVIEAVAEISGYPLTWTRSLENPPNEQVKSDGDGLQLSARKAGEEIRAGIQRQLPLLAYYGTQRLWPTDIKADDSRQPVGNRLDGYRDCLNAASTHNHMLDWIRKYTFVELQKGEPVVQLRAIQRAVVACVEEAERFYYDVKYEQLILVIDGENIAFDMLSDGYRNIVAMVADIAWRAVVLNPELRELAPELAEGVVLIDEIDLHLHPRWQRRVLADLRRAFPCLQFITTTHSPFIIQSLKPGQLRNLDADVEDAGAYANESPEDIVERHMGVAVPQRSWRRQKEYEVAVRYFKLLEQLPSADQAEVARLKTELDTILAPYSDNQAFVAFLEFKRELAEVKGS